MPALDATCYQAYLHEFSLAYPDSLNLLIGDGAPAHIAQSLRIPDNVLPVRLPPYSPELNPIERLWQDLRKWLGSELPASLAALKERIDSALEGRRTQSVLNDYANEGFDQLNRGFFKAARAAFEKALKLNPKFAQGFVQSGGTVGARCGTGRLELRAGESDVRERSEFFLQSVSGHLRIDVVVQGCRFECTGGFRDGAGFRREVREAGFQADKAGIFGFFLFDVCRRCRHRPYKAVFLREPIRREHREIDLGCHTLDH
jgi:hypothetical protein